MNQQETSEINKKIDEIRDIVFNNIKVLETPAVKRIENCLNLCYLKINKIIKEDGESDSRN